MFTTSVPPGRRSFEVRLEGRRVHRHQAIGSITGGEDVEVGDLDLEGRDPGQGPGGSPNLGRKRGEGRQVVPEVGAGVGEPPSGYLHPVAGVAGEANDDLVDYLSIVVKIVRGAGRLRLGRRLLAR